MPSGSMRLQHTAQPLWPLTPHLQRQLPWISEELGKWCGGRCSAFWGWEQQ